jgi:hypothetical protein
MKRRLALLLVGTSLLAACGGGSGNGKAAATDQSTTASTDDSTDAQTDKSVDTKADKTKAKKAIKAWETAVGKEGFTRDASGGSGSSGGGSGGSDASDGSDSANSTFVFTSKECKAFEKLLNATDDATLAEFDSADFATGSFDKPGDKKETLSASVTVAEDDAGLDDTFALLADSKLSTCLKEGFTNSFNADPTPGATFTIDVTTAKPGKIGDKQGGFEVKVTVKAGPIEVPVDLVFLFVGKGHIGVAVFDGVTGVGKAGADLDGELQLLLDKATK